MTQKIILGLTWIGFIVYAIFLSPPQQPDTWDLILNLSTGNVGNINFSIVSLFNLMGVLPIIYLSLLLFDGQTQKIPAYPFAIASFGLGAFAILPYLILRQPNKNPTIEKNWLLKILDSPIAGILLTIGTIVLLVSGFIYGNWNDFIQEWHNSKFINVMSLDFCLLSLLLPVLVKDDLARRGIENNTIFWGISLLPLFGTLIYLCLRSFISSDRKILNSF